MTRRPAWPEEGDMGLVITFPLERRIEHDTGQRTEGHTGTVVILPVIRVDRRDEERPGGIAPGTGSPPSGGRRRRAMRS
jgi:hypothetical protein